MLKGRLLALLLLCLLCIITTGCWDRKEIETRGFVLGIAVDYVTMPESKGKYDLPKVVQEHGRRKYRVTLEMPRFSKAEGEKSADSGNHYIFSGEGESLMEIVRSINAKTYFSPFLEDTQIMIFSEEVARDGIGDLLDFFLRNPGMRRQVKLFVTPGRAEDVLKGKLNFEEANSIAISKTMRNVNIAPNFASVINLGNVSKAIREKRSFAMAEVLQENGEIKLTQAALFNKETKMVGVLSEYEVVGSKIIRKILKGGAFSVPNPANEEKLIIFDLLEPVVKVNSFVDNDRVRFSLEGEFAGILGENTEIQQDVLKPDFLSAVEQAVADEFTKMIQASFARQQALKVDTVMLGDLVYRQHPHYWDKIKDRWDEEIFPAATLDIKIRVIVRRPGMTR
ncbi:Spore germination protein A3 precursor [Sporomusa ovata DSM 2662]|uniref:Spore germination protein GerKC n=2 Tax=Sporomusa ovata TaxID=2378 RepID=A0A0U1L1N0_9FIRM|nr:Ger(x)C family spore germination protein [Sporomusa ovata]EQB25040.1 spore germination protein A3 [Sporomusa ovata DSM 2662]CQR73590.1 Spore germination protein GerKC [Sporomusa ovata]